jgi:hypothetical protein
MFIGGGCLAATALLIWRKARALREWRNDRLLK